MNGDKKELINENNTELMNEIKEVNDDKSSIRNI